MKLLFLIILFLVSCTNPAPSKMYAFECSRSKIKKTVLFASFNESGYLIYRIKKDGHNNIINETKETCTITEVSPINRNIASKGSKNENN